MTHRIWPLDASAYDRHPLHQGDRAWTLSNCYVDVYVELMHAAGLEPLAALPFTLAIDAEGDQWTFIKFPLADLRALYGLDVFELNVWRPLLEHVETQLLLGRPSIVEVDAYYLPDTFDVSYHTEHVKTSIGVQALDTAAKRLGYFHNAGYYELEGSDFAGVFRVDDPETGSVHLPPYVEVVKLPSPRSQPTTRSLVARSLELLAATLARVPDQNPFRRYSAHFSRDLSWLTREPLAQFHRYAFATFRQIGSAFELGAAYVRWLQANGEGGLGSISAACDVVASSAVTLQLKTARAVRTHRPFDAEPLLGAMADAWEETLAGLRERYGAAAAQRSY